MKVIDNETGEVIEETNSKPSSPLSATEISQYLGVPVKYVVFAGIVLLLLPLILNKR
jgi:hypothetical protein